MMHIKSTLFTMVFISVLSAQSNITVSTPTEFLNAIGSNKTIYLNNGDYDLSSVIGVGATNVSWETEYDGSQILISNVTNMKIVGKENARVLVSPQYTWVLKFYQCNNIILDNFTMGHTIGGSCTGGVIYMDSCRNVIVSNCNLFGSGTYGMEINNSENITVLKSNIYKCSYGLLTLNNSTNLHFIKTSFTETGEFDLINIINCKSVNFKTCVFDKNFSYSDYGSYYLFKIDQGYSEEEIGQSTDITINTSIFRDNSILYFSSNEFKIRIGDNRFERNSFQTPLPTANFIQSKTPPIIIKF